MDDAGLDALVVAGKGHWWTGRGYFRYFTDFHIWGHDGLICIPKDGDPFLVFSSYAVAERIAARGWITDTAGDVYIAPRMVELMQAKGITQGRVGLVGRRFILSVGNYEELVGGLPNIEWVDADAMMDHIRAIKSDLEIQQNRELWTLAKAAMEKFVEEVAPGRTQREVAAEAVKLVIAGGARDMLIFMGEEPGATPPSDAPLRCDGILRYHMEILNESGHWCELTVNLAFRPPTDLEIKLMESEIKAQELLHRMAKPGVRLSELAAAFEASLREDGWELGAPTAAFDFHGQGMDCIEYPWHAARKPWGQSQDWPLEAGMTFSFHPHRSVIPAVPWGTGNNENLLITPNGGERFSGNWDHRWRIVKP
jgi:Xaa-Pro aminopeptidase